MKQSKREYMEANRRIRKQMAPYDRVILNLKDVQKAEKFDWRRELEDMEDNYEEGLDDED